MGLIQTAFRLPASIVGKLDHWVNELNALSVSSNLSKSDVIREVLLWSLPQRPPIDEQFVNRTLWPDLVQIAIRIPSELMDQLDLRLKEINTGRTKRKFNRTDLIRTLLAWSISERPEWQDGKFLTTRDRAIESSIFQFDRCLTRTPRERCYVDVKLSVPVAHYPPGERFDFAVIDFSASVLKLYQRHNDAVPGCVARLRMVVTSILKESA